MKNLWFCRVNFRRSFSSDKSYLVIKVKIVKMSDGV